jgi:hypothetical protein
MTHRPYVSSGSFCFSGVKIFYQGIGRIATLVSDDVVSKSSEENCGVAIRLICCIDRPQNQSATIVVVVVVVRSELCRKSSRRCSSVSASKSVSCERW